MDTDQFSSDPVASPEPPADLDERQLSRISKFLSLVLRHRAHQFGLPMDDEGFVPLDELLEVIREQDGLEWVDRGVLERVGGNHVRKRFEIREDRARATYGHSFHKPVRYPVIEPPEELYVGMPRNQSGMARSTGLQPDGRQYVHLTDDREEAVQVGQRRGQEADVIVVRAREAAAAGIRFHKATEGLFLSGPIPATYLETAVRFGRTQRRIKHRKARA